jgi:hypothetical protein
MQLVQIYGKRFHVTGTHMAVWNFEIVSDKYNVLAGLPGVAWDEKLQKQIFEITWRDKGWIG